MLTAMIREAERQLLTAYRALRRPGVPTCSVCLRVELRGRWLDAENAIRELRTYERTAPPRLAAALCPSCEETIAYRRVA
jgi:hypothetical protein